MTGSSWRTRAPVRSCTPSARFLRPVKVLRSHRPTFACRLGHLQRTRPPRIPACNAGILAARTLRARLREAVSASNRYCWQSIVRRTMAGSTASVSNPMPAISDRRSGAVPAGTFVPAMSTSQPQFWQTRSATFEVGLFARAQTPAGLPGRWTSSPASKARSNSHRPLPACLPPGGCHCNSNQEA
jgi:hypothetical protein